MIFSVIVLLLLLALIVLMLLSQHAAPLKNPSLNLHSVVQWKPPVKAPDQCTKCNERVELLESFRARVAALSTVLHTQQDMEERMGNRVAEMHSSLQVVNRDRHFETVMRLIDGSVDGIPADLFSCFGLAASTSAAHHEVAVATFAYLVQADAERFYRSLHPESMEQLGQLFRCGVERCRSNLLRVLAQEIERCWRAIHTGSSKRQREESGSESVSSSGEWDQSFVARQHSRGPVDIEASLTRCIEAELGYKFTCAAPHMKSASPVDCTAKLLNMFCAIENFGYHPKRSFLVCQSAAGESWRANSTSPSQAALGVSCTDASDSIDYEREEEVRDAIIRFPSQVSLSARFASLSLEHVLQENLSAKYWHKHYVDFDDRIKDGFYDIGRRRMFAPLQSFAEYEGSATVDSMRGSEGLRTLGREVLVVGGVDRQAKDGDDQMARWIVGARSCVAKGRTQLDRIKLLASFVSSVLSGASEDGDDNIGRKARAHVLDLKSRLKTEVLPLGMLRVGVCRHRALLFKVLADQCGIRSRLIRGSFEENGDSESELSTNGAPASYNMHAWNIVLIEKRDSVSPLVESPGNEPDDDDETLERFMVVDLMNQPISLYDVHSAQADMYRRSGGGTVGGASLHISESLPQFKSFKKLTPVADSNGRLLALSSSPDWSEPDAVDASSQRLQIGRPLPSSSTPMLESVGTPMVEDDFEEYQSLIRSATLATSDSALFPASAPLLQNAGRSFLRSAQGAPLVSSTETVEVAEGGGAGLSADVAVTERCNGGISDPAIEIRRAKRHPLPELDEDEIEDDLLTSIIRRDAEEEADVPDGNTSDEHEECGDEDNSVTQTQSSTGSVCVTVERDVGDANEWEEGDECVTPRELDVQSLAAETRRKFAVKEIKLSDNTNHLLAQPGLFRSLVHPNIAEFKHSFLRDVDEDGATQSLVVLIEKLHCTLGFLFLSPHVDGLPYRGDVRGKPLHGITNVLCHSLDIARAIHYLHSHGLTYGEIHPDSIMIDLVRNWLKVVMHGEVLRIRNKEKLERKMASDVKSFGNILGHMLSRVSEDFGRLSLPPEHVPLARLYNDCVQNKWSRRPSSKVVLECLTAHLHRLALSGAKSLSRTLSHSSASDMSYTSTEVDLSSCLPQRWTASNKITIAYHHRNIGDVWEALPDAVTSDIFKNIRTARAREVACVCRGWAESFYCSRSFVNVARLTKLGWDMSQMHMLMRQSKFVTLLKFDDMGMLSLEHLHTLLASAAPMLMSLSFAKSNADDSVMELVAKAVHSLKNLDVSSCKITDEGLKHISTLPTLQHLNITDCPEITQNGLLQVFQGKKFKTLTHLSVHNVTDTVVKAMVSHCRSLLSLNLSSLKLTERGIRTIVDKLPQLRLLNVAECPELRNIMKLLAGFTSLRVLYLDFSSVKHPQDFAKHIVKLPTLRRLELFRCEKLNDDSVRCFKELRNLRVLNIASKPSALSPSTIAEAVCALPGVFLLSVHESIVEKVGSEIQERRAQGQTPHPMLKVLSARDAGSPSSVPKKKKKGGWLKRHSKAFKKGHEIDVEDK